MLRCLNHHLGLVAASATVQSSSCINVAQMPCTEPIALRYTPASHHISARVCMPFLTSASISFFKYPSLISYHTINRAAWDSAHHHKITFFSAAVLPASIQPENMLPSIHLFNTLRAYLLPRQKPNTTAGTYLHNTGRQDVWLSVMHVMPHISCHIITAASQQPHPIHRTKSNTPQH